MGWWIYRFSFAVYVGGDWSKEAVNNAKNGATKTPRYTGWVISLEKKQSLGQTEEPPAVAARERQACVAGHAMSGPWQIAATTACSRRHFAKGWH